MLSGGMKGCSTYGETKSGAGGGLKLPVVEFHKICKLNLPLILILTDRCVIHSLWFFFLEKKLKIE